MADVLLELPADQRDAFKEPMGPVLTDTDELLSSAGGPIIAVGDVVTYHLEAADRQPDVAVVDERTEREAVDDEVRAALREPDVTVENPPATLTRELLAALSDALAAEDPRVVMVEGEEDLAAVPAVMAAPDGAAVVYGQPGEGMVLATVDEDARWRAGELFDVLRGDHAAARAALGLD